MLCLFSDWMTDESAPHQLTDGANDDDKADDDDDDQPSVSQAAQAVPLNLFTFLFPLFHSIGFISSPTLS